MDRREGGDDSFLQVEGWQGSCAVQRQEGLNYYGWLMTSKRLVPSIQIDNLVLVKAVVPLSEQVIFDVF